MDNLQFPEEKAVSGWFRWQLPIPRSGWFSTWRLTINDPATLTDHSKLGDRTLNCWYSADYRKYYFMTYSYTDNKGAGNPNIYLPATDVSNNYYNNVPSWAFLYYGYSRVERKAYAYVKFNDFEVSYTFPNINHYLSNKYWIYVPNYKWYNSFNGLIAYFRVQFGPGAYNPNTNFAVTGDRF